MSWLLLTLLFAVNLYRAATQSITTDEAFTYTRSVIVPIPELWKIFDANDHILHTLLCKLTTRLFGASEFTLRIPALLGGLLYLVICLKLCMMATAGAWPLLLAYSLLVLNPMMLDYCSIARGYGMATSLVLLALHQSVLLINTPTQQWRAYAIAISLALAVTANLTVLFPSTALVLSLAAYLLIPPALQRQWPRVHHRLSLILDRIAVPCVLITTVVLLVPLLPARREHFYVGLGTLSASAVSIVHPFLWRAYFALEPSPAPGAFLQTAIVIAPLLPLAIFAAALAAIRKSRAPLLGMLLGVTALSTLILIALHAATGLLYPERRTGLYFIPLFTLLAITAVPRLPRLAQAAGTAFGVLCLTMFLLAWNVRYYDEWAFDADNRAVMEYIRDRVPTDGRKLTIGATFPFHRNVEYYRLIWNLTTIAPVKEGATGSYDVYVLAADQRQWIDKHKLTVRRRFPFGLTVAASQSSALRP